VSRPDVTSGDAGFTLVEALMATLLMGIIMAALASVTAQWLPSWDRGIGRLQRVEILALSLDRVVADIAAAEIISPGDGKGPPVFDGGELSITFVRTQLNPNATGGLEVVRLAEVGDERGPVLVRSTAPFVPTADASSADAILFSNPVTMVRAPYRVAFSYAGPDRVWRDTWHQQTALPRAVRVQLRDLATSETLAVSTTVPIHAELPASCTWATTVDGCPELAGRSAPALAAGLTGAP
jgi:general secretion pathway protein J